MPHGRRRALRLSLIALVAALTIAPACTKTSDPADSTGTKTVYVLSKIMPVGMLVATARADNVMELKTLPADVAGTDAIADTNGLECLVAAQSLPAGTVVRRNQLVSPGDIGLNRGLTGDTSPRPSGC